MVLAYPNLVRGAAVWSGHDCELVRGEAVRRFEGRHVGKYNRFDCRPVHHSDLRYLDRPIRGCDLGGADLQQVEVQAGGHVGRRLGCRIYHVGIYKRDLASGHGPDFLLYNIGEGTGRPVFFFILSERVSRGIPLRRFGQGSRDKPS